MFFKQHRINKLKIKIAGLEAASSISVNYISGDTNSIFINAHTRNETSLAEAKMLLSILESK